MNLTLSQLKSRGNKKRRRIGRGNAGKGGTYGGRGLKGQRARSGGKRKAGFLGKKSPVLLRQIPKVRGFKSLRAKLNIVNLEQLNHIFSDGEAINPQKLLACGLISGIFPGVKILGKGKLKKRFTVLAHRFSKSAEDAIKKAGGNVQYIKLEQKKKNVVRRKNSATMESPRYQE